MDLCHLDILTAYAYIIRSGGHTVQIRSDRTTVIPLHQRRHGFDVAQISFARRLIHLWVSFRTPLKNRRLLIFLSVLLVTDVGLGQYYYLVPITAEDKSSATVTDTFGFHCNATTCDDGFLSDGLTETELPPIPPAHVFDMRFVNPLGPDTNCIGNGARLYLIRPNDATSIDTFAIRLQDADTNYPMRLSWSRTVTNHSIFLSLVLRDGIFGFFSVDMLAETTAAIDPHISRYIIISKVLWDFCPPASIQQRFGNLPDRFVLYQNYPNPFNPQTTIRYDLPMESFIKLSIYDLLGNEVRKLVNRWEHAGEKTVEFDAGDLPSGVYVCYLQSRNSFVVQKMLLMR